MDPESDTSTDPDRETGDYPWEHGRTLPEDRALGLELELIELEHEREEAASEGGPTEPIEDDIVEVLDELEEAVEAIVEPDEAGPVEIHAPEAADLVERADDTGSEPDDPTGPTP